MRRSPKPNHKRLGAALVGIGLLIGVCGGKSQGPSTTNASSPQRPISSTKKPSIHSHPIPQPPYPIQGPTPAQLFRRLLKQTPEQRAQFLRQKTPDQRRLIEQKLQEFEALPPLEREIRLRIWDLRYYLDLLLSIPPPSRAVWLAQVPETYRSAVQERLEAWEKLPDQVKQDLKANRRALEFLIPVSGTPPKPPGPGSSPFSESYRSYLQKWNQLPLERRKEALAQFRKLFELSPQERLAMLQQIEGPFRKRLIQLQQSLEKLPPAEREACFRSLVRFATLPPEEQERFLRKAEIWARMTPEQRAAWKRLMQRLPPLPPPPIPIVSSQPWRSSAHSEALSNKEDKSRIGK